MKILDACENYYIQLGFLSSGPSFSDKMKKFLRNFVSIMILALNIIFTFLYAFYHHSDDFDGAVNSFGCSFSCIHTLIKYVLLLYSPEQIINVIESFRTLVDEGLFSLWNSMMRLK